MVDSRAFASLSPKLLARKGSARPAMRPQVHPLSDFQHDAYFPATDDLGWNDMGEPASVPVRVVPIDGGENGSAATPEVVIRQKMLAQTVARSVRAGGSALAKKGKRAALTLRIDADRHSRLRLACSETNRSAQQFLTEALDRMLAEMPETLNRAAKARKRS